MAPPSLELGRREAHVWLATPSVLDQGQITDRYLALLTEDERQRHGRFRFPEHRGEFLLTRALARTTLSRYVPSMAPRQWRFRFNAHGRPEIDEPSLGWLRFNLTNTRGLIACIVARDLEVGIDAECLERSGQTLEIADRFFSKVEVEELRSLPAARQRDRFFDYWTLKEAYIKARGMGLALPLDGFSFFPEPRPVRIAFAPSLHDDPADWQFEQFAPTAQHKVAVAIQRGRVEDLRVHVRWVRPLLDEADALTR